MPLDKNGKHHLNTQKAMASDKADAAPKPESAPKPEAAAPPAAPPVAAAPPAAPPMEAAPAPMGDDSGAYLSQLQSTMGGKHVLVNSGDDGTVTTTSIGEDGTVEGPLPHDGPESLNAYMDQFLGGGGMMQAAPPVEGMPEAAPALSGM